MAASTFQVGQTVYFIESNVPQTDTVKVADSETTDSQVNTYYLTKTPNIARKQSELQSSKANLISALTTAINALP